MKNGSITSKDIIGWVVSVLISLVPLLIFYLKYRIDRRKSNKKIEILEEMLYKQEIALKDLKIKELEKENEKLKKETKLLEAQNKELKKKKLGRN